MTGKNETAKSIGALLRRIGLKPMQAFHGRYGIHCRDLHSFLDTKSPKSPSHPAQENQGLRVGDVKDPSHLKDDTQQNDRVTWVTSRKQSHLPQNLADNMDEILRQTINDIDAGRIWNITPEVRRIEDDIDPTYVEVLAGSKTIEAFNALCLCLKCAGTQGAED